jgi:steroid 5-alpha reductase family enzyme
VLFLLCLAGETVADQQQWRFQQAKAARAARGEAGPRFCTGGLFRFSRHPNFFCELAMWWLLYGFAVVASGEWLGWTGIGALALTALFQGSTVMTEGISRSRYPEYAENQRTTSRLVPWLPARS